MVAAPILKCQHGNYWPTSDHAKDPSKNPCCRLCSGVEFTGPVPILPRSGRPLSDGDGVRANRYDPKVCRRCGSHVHFIDPQTGGKVCADCQRSFPRPRVKMKGRKNAG